MNPSELSLHPLPTLSSLEPQSPRHTSFPLILVPMTLTKSLSNTTEYPARGHRACTAGHKEEAALRLSEPPCWSPGKLGNREVINPEPWLERNHRALCEGPLRAQH